MLKYYEITELQRELLDKAYQKYLTDPETYERLTHVMLFQYGAAVNLLDNEPLYDAYNDLLENGLIFHASMEMTMYYSLSPEGIEFMKNHNSPRFLANET